MAFDPQVALLDPVLIDRALAQTARAGLKYAVVDIPSIDEWLKLIGKHGDQTFAWWLHCGHRGWNFKRMTFGETGNENGPYMRIEDGCYRICLLPAKHEGDCA